MQRRTRVALGIAVAVGLVVLAVVGRTALRFFRARAHWELVHVADAASGRVAVARFGYGFRESELVVYAADGKEVARRAWDPRAYPVALRGDAVLYQKCVEGRCELGETAVSGGEPRVLVAVAGTMRGVRVAHDGRVAFVDGPYGAGTVRIVAPGGAAPVPAPGAREGDEYPSFTPDGAALVVSAADARGRHLERIDRTTGARTALTPEGGSDDRPAVSTDGTQVAFIRGKRLAPDGDAEVADLLVLDLATGTTRQLASPVCLSSPPTWLSPTDVVYGAWEHGTCTIRTPGTVLTDRQGSGEPGATRGQENQSLAPQRSGQDAPPVSTSCSTVAAGAVGAALRSATAAWVGSADPRDLRRRLLAILSSLD